MSNRIQDYFIKQKPERHCDKIAVGISETFQKGYDSLFRLGQAGIIALVLQCYCNDKYKIEDLRACLNQIMENSPELKEMVYECMKDW